MNKVVITESICDKSNGTEEAKTDLNIQSSSD